MRNRAKCKLCGSIIESFHHHDLVACKCGEISIYGGQYEFACSAKDFKNFLRVDDEDNEIVVRYQEESPQAQDAPPRPLASKEELIGVVQEMIDSVDRLPQQALSAPMTNSDYQAVLLVILRMLKLEV